MHKEEEMRWAEAVLAIHRKRLIITPPGFETVIQRRIYTGAYGNLIPSKTATKVVQE